MRTKNFAAELRSETLSVSKQQRLQPKLANWFHFTSMLVDECPTETETYDLLAYECQHEQRDSFMKKLHQRYAALRRDRERAEIGIVEPEEE